MKQDLAADNLYLEDIVDMEHGVDVLHLVVEEHKQEEELASEVLVDVRVWDLLFKEDLVALQGLLHDMVHLEHGADARFHAEEEYKQEDELVLGVLLVDRVVDLLRRQELVVLQKLLQDGVVMEHGADALFHAVKEHKREDELVHEVLVVDLVLDQLSRHDLVVSEVLLAGIVHLDHGADVLFHVDEEHKREDERVEEVLA